LILVPQSSCIKIGQAMIGESFLLRKMKKVSRENGAR